MEGISEEVTEKIEKILEEKQILKINSHKERNSFYEDNIGEIKEAIEQIICERRKKLTLLQLYNLILAYFNNNTLSNETGEYIKKLASLSKSNSKNLRLLKSILEMTNDKEVIKKTIIQLNEISYE